MSSKITLTIIALTSLTCLAAIVKLLAGRAPTEAYTPDSVSDDPDEAGPLYDDGYGCPRCHWLGGAHNPDCREMAEQPIESPVYNYGYDLPDGSILVSTGLKPGMRIKFLAEKQRYTVQACDERFAICSKPMNALKTVIYTIIDFRVGVRGPEDLIFGHGAETREQCEEMLARLNEPLGSEVSYRHRMPLDIERIDPPKGVK